MMDVDKFIDAVEVPELGGVEDKLLSMERAEVCFFERLCVEVKNGSLDRAGQVVQLMKDLSLV